jgi:hypothetical protein
MIFLQVVKKKRKILEKPHSTRTPRYSFRGAFYCQAYESTGLLKATFKRGYVNGLEPSIGSKLISSGAELSGPIQYDESDRCYLGVTLKVDPTTGRMLATNKSNAQQNLIMEIRGNNLNQSRNSFFHPVALWHKDSGLHQLSYHDLLHISIVQFQAPRHLIFAS